MEFKTLLAVGVLISSVFLGAGYAAAEGAAVSEPHPLVGASFDAIGGSGLWDVQEFLATAPTTYQSENPSGLDSTLPLAWVLLRAMRKGSWAEAVHFSGAIRIPAISASRPRAGPLAALAAGVLVQSVVGISATGTSVALEASRAATARTKESSESTRDGINRNGFDLE